jgi:hypothetical protein
MRANACISHSCAQMLLAGVIAQLMCNYVASYRGSARDIVAWGIT